MWLALAPTEDKPPEVIPTNDLREYQAGCECWCSPRWDDGVLVHNSMDRREEYERGERKPS